MLLISTRLGLIACRYLTDSYYKNKWTSAPEIADRYNINVRAVMPALRHLTRAGILKSQVGGREPGFMLVNDPKDVSLLDVLTALEGEYSIPCCKTIIRDLQCDCENSDQCHIYSLASEIIDTLKQRLTAISLAEHTGEFLKYNSY